MASQTNTGENRKVLQKVDIAEALTSLVSQMMHTSTSSLQEVVLAKVIVGRIQESSENEDIQTETRLEDCASAEVEMRNGEVGMKYVKDEPQW